MTKSLLNLSVNVPDVSRDDKLYMASAYVNARQLGPKAETQAPLAESFSTAAATYLVSAFS